MRPMDETSCQIESLDVAHTNHCMGHVDEIYGHFHPQMLFNTCLIHFHQHLPTTFGWDNSSVLLNFNVVNFSPSIL